MIGARQVAQLARITARFARSQAAVTLELKKRAKQTNMLKPRLHES